MVEVVAALIWDKDRFMICQRPAHKARGLLWEFVGGKVEPGETKEQALVRECREELAVTLDVGDVFMDVTHEYPDLTVHLTLFHAAIREGVPQKLEHNDIRWITVSEIGQYEFCPADEVILERRKQRGKAGCLPVRVRIRRDPRGVAVGLSQCFRGFNGCFSGFCAGSARRGTPLPARRCRQDRPRPREARCRPSAAMCRRPGRGAACGCW